MTGLVPWRLALKDWSHDVTAFAYHVFAQAAAASFDGAWKARVLEPSCRSVTNRHFHMRYVGHLVFFVYGLAGFAIEMDMYKKSKLPRC